MGKTFTKLSNEKNLQHITQFRFIFLKAFCLQGIVCPYLPWGYIHVYDHVISFQMILKLGMDHQGRKVFKVYINDDPGLTLTYFTARLNLVKIAHGDSDQ